MGRAREDLKAFPEEVKDVTGFALYLAQKGEKHPHALPLKGFGGAGVLEIIEDHAGDTYRTVYTLRMKHAIYVLHAFQKKSKRGIATPPREIDLVRRRLRQAEEHHSVMFAEEGGNRWSPIATVPSHQAAAMSSPTWTYRMPTIALPRPSWPDRSARSSGSAG